MPSISELATNAALTAVENKIPDVSSLVKKTNYDTKITEIENKVTDHNHDKYIATPKFNKLSAEVFDVRLARANVITKADFDDKLKSLNQKINSNKTKYLLIKEDQLMKLPAFDSIYFRGKSRSEEDGTQNYLVFQPICRYFKRVVSSDYILSWKPNGLSYENITTPSGSHYIG